MGLPEHSKLYLWHLILYVVLVVDSSTTTSPEAFKRVVMSLPVPVTVVAVGM